MSDTYYGFDLLFKTAKGDIKNEADLIIVVVHWFLTRNKLLCLGIGDDKTLQQSEVGSELLPDDWNANAPSYALRYIINGELFILHGIVSDGSIVVNLLNVKTLNVSNVHFDMKSTIKALDGSLQTMIPGISNVVEKLRTELLDPVTAVTHKEVETQATSTSPTSNVHFIPIRSDPIPTRFSSYDEIPFRDPLADIGRGDLDPLGRGGGGMLFNIPGPGRLPNMPGYGIPGGLPRNAVPPGARFDPFSPIHPTNPNPNRRQNPDYDHFPPPGFGDNMYL